MLPRPLGYRSLQEYPYLKISITFWRVTGTYSDVKSPQPIKSTSTPGTPAIELEVRCDLDCNLICTYSTSSRALTVSIIQITVVNSLHSVLAYLAGTGAYLNIGIVPVADRSPTGANLA